MTVQGARVLHGSGEERGSWPTSRALVLALLPLVAFVALAIAIDGESAFILPARQVVWFVLGPLLLLYPVVAAIARVHAYAPTTVLVIAAIAPAFTLAGRLLLDPIARDAKGNPILDVSVLQARALPPGIVAVALFLAIEIASAGMRRGFVLGLAASCVAVGIVAGAAIAVLQMTGTVLPALG